MMDERDRSAADGGERKPYTTPSLTEFGTIEDLTQGSDGTDWDGGTLDSTGYGTL